MQKYARLTYEQLNEYELAKAIEEAHGQKYNIEHITTTPVQVTKDGVSEASEENPVIGIGYVFELHVIKRVKQPAWVGKETNEQKTPLETKGLESEENGDQKTKKAEERQEDI